MANLVCIETTTEVFTAGLTPDNFRMLKQAVQQGR